MDLVWLEKYRNILDLLYDPITILIFSVIPLLSIYVSFILAATFFAKSKDRLPVVFLPSLVTVLFVIAVNMFTAFQTESIDAVMCNFQICAEYGASFGAIVILAFWGIPIIFAIFLLSLIIFKVRAKKNIYREGLKKYEYIPIAILFGLILFIYLVKIIFAPISQEYIDIKIDEVKKEQINYVRSNSLDGQYLCFHNPDSRQYRILSSHYYLDPYSMYTMSKDMLIKTTFDYDEVRVGDAPYLKGDELIIEFDYHRKIRDVEDIAYIKEGKIIMKKDYVYGISSDCYNKYGEKITDKYTVVR
ncbi:MAG: hypothetical protein R3B60_04160 [Candidatus Paceibacterota bacterium]